MADLTGLSTTDALVQASFLIQGTLERRAAEQSLSLVQTRLLGVLRDREPTINELADLLGLDKSSVSGLIDRAARRALVERRPSEIDRRSVRVSLTAQGRACVDAVAAALEDDLAAVLTPLEEGERQRLGALLSRVVIAHAGHQGVDLLDVRG
jgi:DNA-binding MarR family transcriptional regulator